MRHRSARQRLTFTEGPIWHPIDHYLLFSDMPADVRRRWDAARGVVEVRRHSNKCNGMTMTPTFNLIVCEHATSSLSRERPDGRRDDARLAFRQPGTQQPERCSACISSGSIYFPTPGTAACGLWRRAAASARLPGLYRVPPAAGRATAGRPLSVRTADMPLLLAGRKAALTSTTPCRPDPHFRRRPTVPLPTPVSCQRQPLRTRAGLPDGMKCDQLATSGAAPGGVWVYAASGDLLGKVRVPEMASNLSGAAPTSGRCS